MRLLPLCHGLPQVASNILAVCLYYMAIRFSQEVRTGVFCQQNYIGFTHTEYSQRIKNSIIFLPFLKNEVFMSVVAHIYTSYTAIILLCIPYVVKLVDLEYHTVTFIFQKYNDYSYMFRSFDHHQGVFSSLLKSL